MCVSVLQEACNLFSYLVIQLERMCAKCIQLCDSFHYFTVLITKHDDYFDVDTRRKARSSIIIHDLTGGNDFMLLHRLTCSV